MRVLILAAILAATLWLVWKSIRPPAGSGGRAGGGKLVQDPVCKTYIPKTDAVTRTHGGKTVHFCSDRCADAYSPEQS